MLELFERVLARFVALEGFDRAMALAGQMFAALLPLLIVISAMSPAGGQDLGGRITRLFHLKGSAQRSVEAAVAQPAAVQSAASLVGIVVLVFSALSFTRALQRLYERAWGLPSLGLRGNEYGLAWLIGFLCYLALHPLFGSSAPGLIGVVTSIALATGLWLVTPYILLARRLSWRILLPQAAVTALAFDALAVGSAVYMPHSVGVSANQFGAIGIAFALLSWLFLAGLVLVVAASVGAVIGEMREGRTLPHP